MRRILYILALFVSTSLYAQTTIDNALVSIENNNTTLKALREQGRADKLANKTDIYLQGLDVEFGYLWGFPSEIGNRTDFGVSQTIDIATIAGMRSRLANTQNGLVDIQYRSDRLNILLQAKQYCLDMIYYNSLVRELSLRLGYAQTIATAYKNRLNRGDVNALEYNKVQLNLSSVKGELARVNVERNSVFLELQRLNGGEAIIFNEFQYSKIGVLPLSFEEWFEAAQDQNPILQYVKQEVEVNKKQITLSKGTALPSISAGYMREKVVGEGYQGVTIGVSIPLWENKNKIKQAKAGLLATEMKEEDSRFQLYSQLKSQYEKVIGLDALSEEYRDILKTINSGELLKKALDAGEISLLEYIVEMRLYYDTINMALESERDFQKAFAELMSVEL